jgi:DNA-binding transcriptional LysR family regulator
MDLTILKYIVAIAEEKKLTRAAEKLHVTSSALSQCIKKLENEIGIPVFEKINGRSFRLTEGGKLYVDTAKKMLQMKKEVYRELEDVQHDNRGSFIFGCSPKRGLAMLANIFPQFHKVFPNIHIELKEDSLNTLYDSVINGMVDIAVLTPLSDQPKLVNLEPLHIEEIVLAIPLTHPKAYLAGDSRVGTLSLQDLNIFKNDSWMLTNKNSMLRNLTDKIFEEAGFFPEKVLLETSSANAHISAIEEEIAVSLIPIPRRMPELDIVIFHLQPNQHRRLYASYRKSYLLSDSQRYFINLMAEFYHTAGDKKLPPHRAGW